MMVKRGSQGFTLLELGIVLLVLSIMLAGMLSAITQSNRIAKQASLKAKMDAIEEALITYRKNNNRLPCPADGTLAITVQNFGVAANAAGDCYSSGSPKADFYDTSGGGTGNNLTVAGVVPVKTIGLSDDYAFDPWGGRFTYVVDKRVTGTLSGSSTSEPIGVLNSHLPVGTTGTFYAINSTTIGSITVDDANGNQRVGNAILVLISHGPNGHGAYQLSGSRKTSGSSNLHELANCHCKSDGTNDTFASVFYMHVNTTDTSSASYNFDDIVRYYTRASFASSNDLQTEAR